MIYRRPEVCIADARGTILMVQLGATRTEWLPEVLEAHVDIARRHGGPRPLIALVRMDKRFPLDIGFDHNLAELRRALQLARPHYAACAVIVSFGGVLRLVMLQALRVIGFLAGESPPMHVCSTAVEAVCWMEPYATSSTVGTFDRLHYLEVLQEMEILLGSAE